MRRFVRIHWRPVGGAVMGLLLVLYLGTSLVIGRQVREAVAGVCDSGQEDPVAALLAVAGSTENSLGERNSAIWALGQLGSNRALPGLARLYTGEPCDHARGLCQRGLARAVEQCRGATNIGALVWRHGDLARLDP